MIQRAKVDRRFKLQERSNLPQFLQRDIRPTVRHYAIKRDDERVLRLILGRHDSCSIRVVSKRFVYVLKNDASPPKYYTGVTSDVVKRLAIHNAGACIHTAKHGPWQIDLVIEFPDERRAVLFERYLKSGSGVAFAQRHLR